MIITRKVLVIAAIAFGVALTGCSAPGTSTAPAVSVSEALPAAPTVQPVAVVAPVGTTVTHNDFTYTVLSVAPGVSVLSGGLSRSGKDTAKGVFIAVTLNVTNGGMRPDTPSVSYSRAYDAAGHQFACSSAAGDYGWSVTPVNPGNSASGYVAFDVPAGTVLTTLEIRSDIVDDAGVRVAL